MEQRLNELKKQIGELAVELIKEGQVDFDTTIITTLISGDVKFDNSVRVYLGSNGEVSANFSVLVTDEELKHVFKAEKKVNIENSLRQRIAELELQLMQERESKE